MSNMEENYLDNLLKNVMEPHPVEPREREQTDTIEEDSENSTIEIVTEEPEMNLDELMKTIGESAIEDSVPLEEPITEEPVEAKAPESDLNLDDQMKSLEEVPVEEPVIEEPVKEEAITEESAIEEPLMEEAIIEESILEEMTMDEPVPDMPELESTDFSLDELEEMNLDALMSDMPETAAGEDSIDLAALEELLGTGTIASDTTGEPMPENAETPSDSDLNLDEINDDLLKDMGLVAESSNASEVTGEEDDFNDVLSLLSDDDSDLAEINDLLKKSDSKAPVQDDMMDLLNQMADDEEKQFSEVKQAEAKSESEPEQVDVETAAPGTKTGKQKKEKAAKKQKVDANGAVIEKKPGVFAKLFGSLTEEFEPEPTEEELAKEAEAKAAAKQEAKAKKEEEKKAKAEENKAKAEEKEAAKKAKAEAAAQQKREKQEAKAAKKAAKLAKEEAERPKNQKRISTKKMVLVTIFAASVLAVVLLFTNYISEEGSLQRARKAYYAGNYQTVYVELYGSELEESDALVQARSKIILKMQRKYDSYVNHMKMGQDVKALNALIEGLRTYDTINHEAEQYGVMAEVDEIKQDIVNVLNANYGLDEAQARELLQNEDEISYTKALNHIIMGNSSDLVSNS